MNDYFKIGLSIIIIIFLVMFFSSSSGYYEYELYKKTALTSEAIKQFEEDIKAGKEIDASNYLSNNNSKEYDNKFTVVGQKISSSVSDMFSKAIQFIFDSFGELIGE